MKKIVTASLALVLLTACGGGSSSSTPSMINPLNTLNRAIAFQEYIITATPETRTFPFGMCSPIKGFMIITNNVATGTIFSLTQKPYIISGRYIPETGGIDGFFTDKDKSAAPYTGVLNSEKGSGTWSDDFGCKGPWEALVKR